VRNLTPINPSTNKSSPRGDKKVYSEATLAEMQKAESSASAPVQVVKTEPPVVKPVEKIVTETIDWMWPTDGKAISTFDEQRGKGIDISGKLGQDVFAVAPGKVIYEGNAMRGYGNIIIVKHANNYLSAYAHNKTNLVKEGQPVARGQKIAEMGNTDTDSVKLHFEIRQAGKPVDPLKLLPQR
jgi:lipoprotein NlpD